MLRRPILLLLALPILLPAAPDGAALYKSRCAICHDGKPQPRMPAREELVARTPEAVFTAMFKGAMVQQAAGLTEEEGRAVARYITGKEFSTSAAPAITNQCTTPAKPFSIAATDWNGWGQEPGNSRYQPKPGITAADVPKLKLKWAFGFPGETVVMSQPIAVGGRVFIGSVNGSVYSLDASTGCTYWTFKASATVRVGVSIGKAANRFIAYFGDTRAYAYALDAETGQQLWRVKVDDHPLAAIIGSPSFYNGRLYVPVVSHAEEASAMNPAYQCCTFRGSIVALDGATGNQVWKSYTVLEAPKPTVKNSAGTQMYGPAGAGVWSSPTIDAKRNLVYAATGNSYTSVDLPTSDSIMAFDLDTGKLAWWNQVTSKDNFTMACGRPQNANCPSEPGPDYDFGASPALRSIGGGKQILVAGQKSSILWGLDPDQKGKTIWKIQLGEGGALGGIEWGPAADDTNAYAAVSDRFKAPGSLSAVKLATGEKLWTKPTPSTGCKEGSPGCQTAMSAAISAIPGVVFAGAVDGHLRAYQSSTGEILWDFDAAQPFDTVNGVKAKGGSFDAPGPAIANGMLFTGSGYGQWGGSAGNVLLAFSINGK